MNPGPKDEAGVLSVNLIKKEKSQQAIGYLRDFSGGSWRSFGI